MLNITIWSSKVFWVCWWNFRLFRTSLYEKQRVDSKKSIDFVPSKILFSSIIERTRVLTQKCMKGKICGTTCNIYWHVSLIIFPIFLFKWKKNVRASRYPLFCLLGHALRRLWDPVPQLVFYSFIQVAGVASYIATVKRNHPNFFVKVKSHEVYIHEAMARLSLKAKYCLKNWFQQQHQHHGN